MIDLVYLRVHLVHLLTLEMLRQSMLLLTIQHLRIEWTFIHVIVILQGWLTIEMRWRLVDFMRPIHVRP